MISAEHLTKKYGDRAVVDNVCLEVRRGCVLGFIGPNGAGKSTTMKMLCGVLPLPEGKVSICGIDLTEHPVEAKSKIGYLPENAPLHASMTVGAFLHYCAEMHGIDKAVRKERIAEVIGQCELGGVLAQEMESLSKGYKRRVCLAQAIMHHPEVLIMDEPTDGLDPNQKREIRALIGKLRSDTAIIVSTHILEEVEAVCDRVAVLTAGKKVFDGTTGEFRALAPDNGGAELILQGVHTQEVLAAAFEGLSFESHPDGELTHVLVRRGTRSGGELLSFCYERALKQGWQVAGCSIREGKLDEVFAMLSKDFPVKPDGKEGRAE